jgi:hypothetical protein
VKALGVHLYLSHGFHSDLFLLSFFFVAWPRGERGKSCRWLGAALAEVFCARRCWCSIVVVVSCDPKFLSSRVQEHRLGAHYCHPHMMVNGGRCQYRQIVSYIC